ncbi:DUF1145 domain-containing protein [Shewanella eurypsychrophilus]|uniref:DUF1145 domain-containing protein n=1 Tax=Shewanella eurypsychrophilus TaxID=2593656 RepID=A0ABX6V2J4_9GAMM|nr:MULTISPECIES: DUF1145 domain-containing protein [Shewanella]QFU20627.1 DUF1145 domain-containing protein [Shewanella sp. YLB-09]QFU20908.1 DUF1145 domain-containing protein [Shewanella sp. YLB-09]QPG56195.1 DUF1145 domain-containing protein [Shewanella eurypsychrophilus]
MNFIVKTGKAITLLAWFLMAYNLIMPFDGDIAVILNILFAVTIFMHCFQVIIFHTLFKSLLTLSKSDYFSVFTFGIFSLLKYRSQVIQKLAKSS